MPEKICKIVVTDGVMAREDGLPLVAPVYVYPDSEGVAWLWTLPLGE